MTSSERIRSSVLHFALTSVLYSAQALGFLLQHFKYLIIGIKIDSMYLYVLGLELSALPMVSMGSTTEPHP